MYALSQIHGVDIMAFDTCSFITFDMNAKENLSSLLITWSDMTLSNNDIQKLKMKIFHHLSQVGKWVCWSWTNRNDQCWQISFSKKPKISTSETEKGSLRNLGSCTPSHTRRCPACQQFSPPSSPPTSTSCPHWTPKSRPVTVISKKW